MTAAVRKEDPMISARGDVMLIIDGALRADGRLFVAVTDRAGMGEEFARIKCDDECGPQRPPTLPDDTNIGLVVLVVRANSFGLADTLIYKVRQ
jgi:hypothetical protein